MQLCAALMKQLFARAKRQNKSASLNTKHGGERSGWWSLDLSGQLGYPLTLEIQGWYGSQPFSWKSVSDGAVVAESRFLQPPGLPLDILRTQDNTLDQGVPSELVALGDHAPFMRYAVYQACACLPAAKQLAEDSPLLLVLTLDWAQRLSIEQGELAVWLSDKRARLLEIIGLPGSSSLARLLRRIPLTPIASWQLDALRKCLQQPEALALLRHLARPNLNHVWFLNRFPASWPKLLEMIEQNASLHTIVWLQRMVEDIQRLAPNGTQIYRASDTQTLQQLHDDLVARFNALSRESHGAALAMQYGDYPEVPHPGDADIVALESWDALLAEGTQMHHCIGSYAAQIAARQVFVYHMQAPEVLTVALTPQGGKWGLQEARGYCNALPGEAALAAIQRWLSVAY
ncbi:MAG: PcfJ domain-containing protein [Pseudomonadota bacterium]|nr:PcfJ domain-containing protein [Pseudomonadota bacterium]